MFNGFPQDTIPFFLDLRFHNNATFFHENQDRYQAAVKEPFYALIGALADDVRSIDPMMEVRPHKCLSHIHRDTRFSRDKSPYRDYLWITFHRAGEPRDGSLSYWFALGPEMLEWGLGFWGENRACMDLLRRRIVAEPRYVKSVLDGCGLPERHIVMGGQSWKRMEVPPTVPQYLKPLYLARDVWFGRTDAPPEWAYSPALADRIRDDFHALRPLYRLLRGCVDDSAQG